MDFFEFLAVFSFWGSLVALCTFVTEGMNKQQSLYEPKMVTCREPRMIPNLILCTGDI